MTRNRFFAVVLGGRAPKCNTELHDVVFAVGETIEATYEQLMDQWFGTVEGLHLDSWIELDMIDGYKIVLSEQAANGGASLYFVNLGGYADGVFGELHANHFLVASDKHAAKSRAKLISSKSLPGHLHTDDLHEVDDCIALKCIGPYYIELKPTDETATFRPVNGYHVIPEPVIQDYLRRKKPPA
jgi:hypothetical protein